MSTIIDYVNKYGDRIYGIEKFNDIDNLVYSGLSYIDFSNIVSEDRKTIKLQDAANLFLRTYSYKEYSKLGPIFRESYKLLEVIKDKPRYKNNQLYNYVYVGNKENQFSALCIRINPTTVYISFEGTDHLLSGWKEDAALAYSFPVNCQKDTIEYINKAIGPFDINVMIGGHSKGGNLAMVAGMYANSVNFLKIKQIYCNDGPGFTKDQFYSDRYDRMIKKTKCIVPNYSIVGMLLNHTDELIVVESTKKDFMAHSLYTWKVDENKLKTTHLSRMSRNIDKSVKIWLLNHTYDQRKKMINDIFDVLYETGVDTLVELKEIKNIVKIIKNMKSIDDETKKLAVEFIQTILVYNLKNMW